MGLLDRIMGGGAPTNTGLAHNAPANQQQPQPQDGNKQQLNPGADPKNMPPNGGSGDGKTQEAISPLDPFKDLWNTKDANGKPRVDPLAQPLFQNDPVKFAEAAKKLNFTANIPPELITKALGGDVQAFSDIINNATQAGFMASAQLNNQVVETATRTNNDRFNSVLEDRFKGFMLNQQQSDNPVLNHPSAAPMLDLAKRQLMAQHPDKNPAEIHKMAESYLVAFGEELQGQKSKVENGNRSTASEANDFTNWG